MLPLVTGTARLVDDPELRFSSGGKAMCRMRLAFSDRKRQDDGSWADGDKAFLDATVWGDEAEHLAEGLTRGVEVLVSGKLRQREYEARDGSKKQSYELVFATVAPTSRFAVVKVSKMQRSGGNGGGQQQSNGGGFDDPWASQGAQPTQGSQQSVQDDSPPF